MLKPPMWSARRLDCDARAACVAVHCAKRKPRLSMCFMLAALAFTTPAAADPLAEARSAKIVGLGAATCNQFNGDILANPAVRRDYLAWAQGFMSGIILSRPPGVDEALDLNPPTFGLMAQLAFLQEHCARIPTVDFSDAVEALYKRLRREPKT